MATSTSILDPGEARPLEGARLTPRRFSGGRIRGDRLTRKKGVSIEFADFRDYADGDDVRHLDWNVFARMDTAVIRNYQDEEDIAVHVLLDGSTSMEFGAPSKFSAARKVAAAISYMALCGGDSLNPVAVGKPVAASRILRGRSSFLRADSWLASQTPDGDQSLSQSLRAFASSKARPGLAIIISDGLDPDIAQAVGVLSGRGHEVGFVQVLSQEELDPDIEGDLRLLDSESGQVVEITATSSAVRSYLANLEAHCDALAAACRRYGGRYHRISSDETMHTLIKELRREGWVA